MRSEVLTAVKMLIFWLATPFRLVGRQDFSPEDGGSMFLRNVDIYLQVHTELLSRRPTSIFQTTDVV
jgi:hypothetical protein